MWKDLTLKEKSAMMKVAIANGITDLNEIQNSYNKYAGGGPKVSKKTDDYIITSNGTKLIKGPDGRYTAPTINPQEGEGYYELGLPKLTISAKRSIKKEEPSFLDKAQKVWNNINLGAAMAENPAVMTASGWKQNENGNWTQEPNDASRELANNLAEISTFSPTNPLNAIVGFAGSKLFKGASKLISLSRKPNLKLDFIDDSKIDDDIMKSLLKKEMTYGKNSGRVIHADYGNSKAGFTKGTTGAYVKDNKVFPGHNPNTEVDYSWWNTDKPYSLGINDKPFTRFISTPEKDFNTLINIRQQTTPIGQWNGKSGFVLKSERVSPEGVSLENSDILEWDPFLKIYNRVKYIK